MSPSRMIMATHDTISAWFWMTNSWLSTGGLLFFFRNPIALLSQGTDALERCRDAQVKQIARKFTLVSHETLLHSHPLTMCTGSCEAYYQERRCWSESIKQILFRKSIWIQFQYVFFFYFGKMNCSVRFC